MRFVLCDRKLNPGTYTDEYDQEIAAPDCTLPQGHNGPCAWVKYKEITYPDG